MSLVPIPLPAVAETGYRPRITASEVATLVRVREEAEGRWMAAARRIATAYDGDLVVPVPDGLTRAAVTNLIFSGVEQLAMRVADPPESIEVVAQGVGPRAADAAGAQRKALLGLLEEDRYRLGKRARARHLKGYGRSPVTVKPDFRLGRPTFVESTPLMVLPGSRRGRSCLFDDMVSVSTQTFGWLRRHYPEAASTIWKGHRWGQEGDGRANDAKRFRLYSYEDDRECVLVLGGQVDRPQDPGVDVDGVPTAIILEAYPNLAGCCTTVMPEAVTLTGSGRTVFEQMIGMMEGRAQLEALSFEAVRRGVFQDEWLIANQNEVPEVIQVPDPATGQIGIVKGGVLQPRPVDPQFAATQAIREREGSERATGGVPAEFGGTASVNTRTGRRGAQVLSSTVDFPVAEAQELLAASLQDELEVAARVDRAWFGGTTRKWNVEWKGARGEISYDPAKLYRVAPTVRVGLTLPGVDQADMVVMSGQKIGMGTLSKRSLMEIDPQVKDADLEEDRIAAEQLDAAWWSSIQTLAAAPDGPWQPLDFARLAQLILAENVDKYEAVQQVQREAQERQAQQVQPGDPAAQPGLSMPGMGVEAGGGAPPDMISPGSQSTDNLNSLLAGLVMPQAGMGMR